MLIYSTNACKPNGSKNKLSSTLQKFEQEKPKASSKKNMNSKASKSQNQINMLITAVVTATG